MRAIDKYRCPENILFLISTEQLTFRKLDGHMLDETFAKFQKY